MTTSEKLLLTENLAIVPTLYVAAGMERTAFPSIASALFSTLQSEGAMPVAGRLFSIVGDNCYKMLDPIESAASIEPHVKQFISMASRPLRLLTTIMMGVGSFAPNDVSQDGFNMTRICVGGANLFPDQMSTFSICIHTTQPTGWTWLEALRERISLALDKAYFYSVMGHGLSCNIRGGSAVFSGVRSFGFRYLGADWDDVNGMMDIGMTQGLRTINWQVEVSKSKLSGYAANADLQAILQGATSRAENWLWKTGPTPSRCDRNAPNDWASIAAYVALDRQLSPIKFSSDFIRENRFLGKDLLDRWRDRWTEVAGAPGAGT